MNRPWTRMAIGVLAGCVCVPAVCLGQEESARARIAAQADIAKETVTSDLARRFLAAAHDLPPIQERTILYRRADRAALTLEQAATLGESDLEGFEETTVDETRYYTLFSTPIAWARPIDLLAANGLNDVNGKRILDFGFGNVGQLRMLASLGALVTGVEIIGMQSAMYSESTDQGDVPRSAAAADGPLGKLSLAFGKWPAEERMRTLVGGGYDLIMTKNVLKYGYIHPERAANPLALIDLGVSDEEFLKRTFDALNPGGLVLIYNLYPPLAAEDEPYRPWAYGENPFEESLVREIGLETLAWNVPDSEAIHTLGRALGWDETDPDDFETSFNSMYTLLRRPLAAD